jgi:hypothetical protein
MDGFILSVHRCFYPPFCGWSGFVPFSFLSFGTCGRDRIWPHKGIGWGYPWEIPFINTLILHPDPELP